MLLYILEEVFHNEGRKAQLYGSQWSRNITEKFSPLILGSWGSHTEETWFHNLCLTSLNWHSPSFIVKFSHLERAWGLWFPSTSVFFIPESLCAMFPYDCLVYIPCLWLCLLNCHFYSEAFFKYRVKNSFPCIPYNAWALLLVPILMVSSVPALSAVSASFLRME